MKLKLPTRRQWLLMAYLPIHFLWYFLLEHFIVDSYYPIACGMDAYIPFCEWFILPYFLWFPYMVLTGFYFLFTDETDFEHYMLGLMMAFFVSTLICTLFPNGQDLRPILYRDNFAAQIIRWTQDFDTNTNVFPSMHVVGAFCVAVSVAKSRTLAKKTWLQVCNWVLCTAIIMATVFLKQHSVLDIFGGIAVSAPVLWLVYKGYPSRWLTKLEATIDRKRAKMSKPQKGE